MENMMVRRTLISRGGRKAIFLIAAIILQCASARCESARTPADDLAAEFKDKVVLLEVNRSNALETKSGSVVLVKLRITKLGNRDFIIGTGYSTDDTDDAWYKDVLVGVPCESILRFHAMTPKQFAEYTKRWKEHSDK
jgi:hypothetical protein